MERFTTSDGVGLRYEVRGEGPPVFVCHGGPSNICDTLIDDLAPLERSSTLVFHDYRGSGDSQTAPPSTYTFERLSDDLDELRAHLGLASTAVLAHSMGGLVALHHALRHPDRCDRLALVATTPCGVPGPMVLPVLRALGPARTVKALLMSARFVVGWSWRPQSAARTEAMYAPMGVTQEGRREVRSRIAAAHPGLPVDNDNAPHLMRAMGSFDLRGSLADVSSPALVLYGSRDAVMVTGGRLLASGLPRAELRVLPEVGHEVFLEAPDACFPLLRDFLTGRPPDSQPIG